MDLLLLLWDISDFYLVRSFSFILSTPKVGNLFGGSTEFKLLVQVRCLGSLKSERDVQKMILLNFSIDHTGTLSIPPLLGR